MESLLERREKIRDAYFVVESEMVQSLIAECKSSCADSRLIEQKAQRWVERLRDEAKPSLMESFLAEYGLSTDEGVALMCLAEAYLRVPDSVTLDALIQDKIGSGRWSEHQRGSRSSLINASTWGLMLTGRLYANDKSGDKQIRERLRLLIKRLGEPVVRTGVAQAMKVLGLQFVRGRDIGEAIKRSQPTVAKGYSYSYDMLGEAAKTAQDAEQYFVSYSQAIKTLADHSKHDDVHENSGISIKLSALYPRYEYTQQGRVMRDLVPKVLALAEQAKAAKIGLTVDAEEADRLDISLDVIEEVLSNPLLSGWDGFGVVVQAYAKHALPVLEWLRDLAASLDRRITVRLVKGAYWDMEIKNAQVLGLDVYPVYTRKQSTDISYQACAAFLLENRGVIYPQFATHNAHTTATILNLAGKSAGYEFQRLHGMGESLHEIVHNESGTRCRIYAPVGVHKDLLAYLVRRLLENGANSSFVNQLQNRDVPAASLVCDPVNFIESAGCIVHPGIPLPPDIYGKERKNSKGLNVNNTRQARAFDQQLSPYRDVRWQGNSLIADAGLSGQVMSVVNPADHQDVLGDVIEASIGEAKQAIGVASDAFAKWSATPVKDRAGILRRIADLFEENTPELIALLIREAGKTRLDGVLEVREAVDFCRYYASQARASQARVAQAEDRGANHERFGIGPFVCISPWNFPLAIFTGQVVAALVCGNTVVAKPAEQTPLVATLAVQLMHKAGVPIRVLTLILGSGATVGSALVADSRTAGVCFTGSTATAVLIDRQMAANINPRAPLIAETGGLNAMIVDSTALPEHCVRDIVSSAFQSAGQRCSALRVLFIQKDVADSVLEMLEGTVNELCLGNPWKESTDIGPVIDAKAHKVILDHCQALEQKGRLLFRYPLEPKTAEQGTFIPPAAFRLDSLDELEQEIFGPILHVLTYEANQLDKVIDAINESGYGLTLGVHSRVGERIDRVCAHACVGNIYVNRNQIGAVVGTQPFGGEGLSGTGPKAGGPHYLDGFSRPRSQSLPQASFSEKLQVLEVADLNEFAGAAMISQKFWSLDDSRFDLLKRAVARLPDSIRSLALDLVDQAELIAKGNSALPGPTGERNSLSVHGRGLMFALGGGDSPQVSLLMQSVAGLACGNAVAMAYLKNNALSSWWLQSLSQEGLAPALIAIVDLPEPAGFSLPANLKVVAIEGEDQGDDQGVRNWRIALAESVGPRLPLISLDEGLYRLITERVVSVDTTASGGNTSLLTLDPDGPIV